MQYVNLGRTGLKVSRLCLGAMTYGDPAWRSWVLSEEAGRPFIKRALEAGINFFDTADMYSRGVSEEILGRAIRDFVPHRDDVVIATKVNFPMSDAPNDRGLSRKHIMSAIDASLRGLARRHDIQVQLSSVDMGERLKPLTEVAAYRIVQEALTNVARHSRAAHCSVKLMRLSSKLVVEVEDDGEGFTPESTRSSGSFGLIGIRERAVHLGGTFRLDSAPGRGTRLIVELPAEAASA